MQWFQWVGRRDLRFFKTWVPMSLSRGHAGCQSFSVQMTSDAMDQRVTILPIASDYFWPGLALLGLLLATGRIY
jgi:hypothetical protein